MRNMIPRFIHDKYKEKIFKGDFYATTIFMDISGFTPITEKLMTKGKVGAEILSVILNNIFIPIITAIYERDGFISAFEGDAFTIIFPEKDEKTNNLTYNNISREINAIYSALKIRALFDNIGTIDTVDYGEFPLAVKIGLSYSKVNWGIVGTEKHKTYYFRGEAIDGCANAEHQCNKGDIILDKKFINKIDKNILITKKQNSTYFLLKDLNIKEYEIQYIKKLPNITKEIALQFLPEKALEHKQVGEFRDVVSLFISFKLDSIKDLNFFIGTILTEVNALGGFFEGLNFGDKGANALIFFGAPTSYENNIERAINFVKNIMEDCKDIIRIGITYGKIYSGVKGSQVRCVYGGIGDIINLSARLMMKAAWGEVWVTENIAGKITNNYEVENLGKILFKGKSKPIKVFKLIGIKYTSLNKLFEGRLIGRQEELNKLTSITKEILNMKFGGIVYLYGEAGIGKSRLLYELTKNAKAQIKTLNLQADGILRKSMNPFIYFFNNYFKQNELHNTDEKKEVFEKIFNKLVNNLNVLNKGNIKTLNKHHIDLEKIIKELIRTKSLIAALLGIYWENSLYESLGAKARFENTLSVIKEFFKAESLLNPLIIILDDIHYIDEDSKTVFDALTKNIENFPIILIASGRFYDDGSKPKVSISKEVLETEIILGELLPESVYLKIKEHLKKEANKELFLFILSKTAGNPFYIEQFCLYLLENNLIEKEAIILNDNKEEKKVYRLKTNILEIPSSINSIIVSRIDRLSSKLKETIQIASILGNDFDINIFYKVLNILQGLIEYLSFVLEEEFDMWALSTILKTEEVKTLMLEGEKERLWYSVSTDKYVFRHHLLREVVYEMQARKRLQNLHRITAEAIEIEYKNDKIHYSDLAFHYEKADIKDEAKKYLWKAGEYSTMNYKNQEAILIYDRLLKYVDNREEEIEIYYKKGKILDIIGEWNKAIEIIDNGIELSKKTGNRKKEAELKVLKGKIYQERSEYDKALSILLDAKNISEAVMNKKSLAYSLDNIGEIFRLKGLYDIAMRNFQKSLVIDAEIGNKHGASDSLNNIGNIYRHKQQYDKALECHFKSIAMKENIGDKDGIALAYNNIAVLYWNKGDNDKSLEYLKKSLIIKEEMGNKRGKCISLNNIGIIYKDKGEYDKALEYHQQSLSINKEVGDKRGVAMCTDDVGIIYLNKKQYQKAIEYFQLALDIKKQIGSKGELGHTYANLGYVYYKLELYQKALETILLHFENIQEVKIDFERGKSHLVVALVLNSIDKLRKKSETIKEIFNKISLITKLELKPENYFEKAIETSLNSNFLNTLIPALYEYGLFQYKNGIKDGINKIKEAKKIALKSSMMGELKKIEHLSSQLKISI